MTMSMLTFKQVSSDSNNLPLAFLVEQDKHNVDVNFIAHNKFNNNVYINKFRYNSMSYTLNPANSYDKSY